MINILLYISFVFIFFGFLIYLIILFCGKQKNIFDCSGFDVTKDIISEYDSINVIESTGYFTVYNLKRKVIKLCSWCYYGNDLSSISLSLIESGISFVDNNKNKYLDIFRIIFNNLKVIYIFPIISLVINYSSFNVNDAKISLIFVLIFIFVFYIFIDIKNEALYFINNNIEKVKNISKDNSLKIIKFINKLMICDKFIFFGQLIIILRLVIIMLDIK